MIESFWGRRQAELLDAAVGSPASISPTRSSNTWKSSTTANAATARSACSPRPSMKGSTPPSCPPHEPTNATPSNRGNISLRRHVGGEHVYRRIARRGADVGRCRVGADTVAAGDGDPGAQGGQADRGGLANA